MHDKITNTKGYKVKLTLSNPAVIGEYMYQAVSLRNFEFHLHIHACWLHIRQRVLHTALRRLNVFYC